MPGSHPESPGWMLGSVQLRGRLVVHSSETVNPTGDKRPSRGRSLSSSRRPRRADRLPTVPKPHRRAQPMSSSPGTGEPLTHAQGAQRADCPPCPAAAGPPSGGESRQPAHRGQESAPTVAIMVTY